MDEPTRVRSRLMGRVEPVISARQVSRYPRQAQRWSNTKAPTPRPSPFYTVPTGAWEGEACVILGGGPSLRKDAVPALKGRARVIAVNNAYLLAPWADVLYAADKRWWEWNASEVHQYTGPLMLTRQNVAGVTRIGWNRTEALSSNPQSLSGWCGGGGAINLAYLFGAKVIILMGFDMRPGNWHDLHKMPHVEGQHRDRFIPAIEAMAPGLEAAGVTVLNTNPESALRCFPFADIEELLAMDDLAAIERDKYMRVWERPEYRKVSPGQLECKRAWECFDPQPNERLIDYGSGPARATWWFAQQGLDAVGVDIAANAAETDANVIEACLWDLPADLAPVEYAYCCDVMEHIPTDKVDAVICEIKARTTKAGYFRIATRPDVMGPRILGRPLHLTVWDADKWRRRFETYWRTVDVVENTGRDLVLFVRP